MRAKAALLDEPMTCITRTGRGILYSDFASVSFFDPVGRADAWRLHEEVGKRPSTDFGPRFLRNTPVFIKYGRPIKRFEILVHARNRVHREQDNWNGWNKMELGDGVASIGSKEEALHIEGTCDIRGIPLEELVNYMAGARMIIGPSSGPMHLATLCGCPQVVWSDREDTLVRYERTWNPFNVKSVRILDRNPSAVEVMDSQKKLDEYGRRV